MIRRLFLYFLVLLSVCCSRGAILFAEEIQQDATDGEEIIVQQKINIQLEETVTCRLPGLKKFLNSVPHIAAVMLVDQDTVSLQGLHVGVSYLYAWFESERQVIKISVRIKDLPKSSVQERIEQEWATKDNFKVEYMYTGNYSRIHDKTDDRTYTNREDTWHFLTLKGMTPYGQVKAYGKIEQIDSQFKLPERTLSFIDFDIGVIPPFTLDIGDSHAYLSKFVLSGITIDGANFQTDFWDEQMYLNLLWGQKQRPHLGSLTSDIQSQDYYVWGTRLEYHPVDTFAIAGNVAGGYGDEKDDNAARQAYGIDASYEKDLFTLDVQTGFESGHYGALATGEYMKDYNLFGVQLFDIQKDYYDVIGKINQQGERGTELYFTYYPYEFLELRGKTKLYQDRFFAAPERDDKINNDSEIGANVTVRQTSFSAVYNYTKNKASLFPYQLDSVTLTATRSFKIFNRNVRVYSSASRYERSGDSAPEFNADRYKFSLGTYVSLNKYISFNASRDWAWVDEKETGEKFHPAQYTTGLTASKGFDRLGLTSTLTLSYSKEESDGSRASFFSDKERAGVTAGLRYNRQSGVEVYVSGGVERVKDTDSKPEEEEKKQNTTEYNLQTGLRYVWDTGFRWYASAPIAGKVFIDKNGNGTYDPGEVGVEQVEIKLLKEKAVTTDAEGFFSFGQVRGKYEYVTVNTSTIPVGYIFTTPEQVKVDISQREKIFIYFGIRTRCEVNGIVFNDVNMNGKYDYGDSGINHVNIIIDDAHALETDVDGRYNKKDLMPGEHTIRILLESLPKNLFIRGKLIESFVVNEGGMFQKDYPLQTVRTIKGTIFYDENANGYRDQNEPGCANVTVVFNQVQAVTNDKGIYIFRELPGGFGKVKPDVQTLPEGYEIAGEAAIGITLPPEAYEVDTVNFPLKKKS